MSTVVLLAGCRVHAHLLRNGKVLSWQYGSTASGVESADGLFTPSPNNFSDLLCAGHIFLADGPPDPLGGWDRSTGASGSGMSNLFDPDAQT